MAKRVLIILRRLNIGGIQTQTALLAGEFLRRGCGVTVLVQKKEHSGRLAVKLPEGSEVYCRDFDRVLQAGADKVSVNTAAVNNPELIREGAARFGNQCIVLGMDAKKDDARKDL